MSKIVLDNDKFLELYRVMIRIRTYETTLRTLSREGKIPARFGMYTGQEGVATGVSAHLKKDDQIGSTHRPVGHLIAKGINLDKLTAELCGKATGFNKGKAGSYHIFDPESGCLGANGIVGASVPMCAGYALRNQIKNDGRVTVSYFGEGGSNQGGIQETLNLAACWNLPIVFICENSSPVVQRMLGHEMDYPQLTIDNVSIRAAGYGMPGSTHDGWDVEEVYRVAGEAINRARSGKGPTLLEFKVHQFEGNLEGRLEANEKDKPFCPIDVLEHKLRIRQILKKDTEEKIRLEELELVQKAVKFALSSPEPDIKEAYTDVFGGAF